MAVKIVLLKTSYLIRRYLFYANKFHFILYQMIIYLDKLCINFKRSKYSKRGYI